MRLIILRSRSQLFSSTVDNPFKSCLEHRTQLWCCTFTIVSLSFPVTYSHSLSHVQLFFTISPPVNSFEYNCYWLNVQLGRAWTFIWYSLLLGCFTRCSIKSSTRNDKKILHGQGLFVHMLFVVAFLHSKCFHASFSLGKGLNYSQRVIKKHNFIAVWRFLKHFSWLNLSGDWLFKRFGD